MLEGDELKEVQKVANDLDTVLEVLYSEFYMVVWLQRTSDKVYQMY